MTGRSPGRPCLLLFDCTYPDAPRVRVDIRHKDGGSTQHELLGEAADLLCLAAAPLAGQAADAVRAEVERLQAQVAIQEAQEAAPAPAPRPARRFGGA